jgi:hypothetical protein
MSRGIPWPSTDPPGIEACEFEYGTTAFDCNMAPSQHPTHLTFELTHGITAGWEASCMCSAQTDLEWVQGTRAAPPGGRIHRNVARAAVDLV